MEYNVNRLPAVAQWGSGLLQYIILVAPVGKVEILILSCLECGVTVLICGKSNQRCAIGFPDIKFLLSLNLAVRIETLNSTRVIWGTDTCLIELELYICNRAAILIHLHNALGQLTL